MRLDRLQVVDVEELADAPLAGRPGARRGRHWWWLPLAGVVALGGLVIGQSTLDERARATAAARAALPGAIDPLGAELTVQWRVDPRDTALIRAGTFDDAFVGLRTLDDGSLAVVALDDATGAQRWERVLRGPDPVRAAAVTPQPPLCHAAPQVDERAVACLVSDGYLAGGGSTVLRVPAAEPHLVVLDARDGAILRDVVLPAGTADAAVTGDVVVAAVQDPPWHVVAVAVDLVTGAERWRYEPPDQRASGSTSTGTDVAVRAFEVGVVLREPSPASRLTVLGADGGVLAEPSTTWSGWAAVGDELWLRRDNVTSRTVVWSPDGSERTVPGRLLTPNVDDGSAGHVRLSDRRVLRAVDTDTGGVLWSTTRAVGSGVAVLGGRMYVPTWSPSLLAVDARSGKVLWDVAVDPDAFAGTPTTDGTSIVVVQRSMTAGTPFVTVHDLVDGRVVARLEPPDGVVVISQEGRRLVGGLSDGTLVVLG
ncbi:outer membrane protein assembly factor BamB family protein [Cellulomonas composti]|uniref:outer membrane protein assembly factor BamB family protein n=1 Tax=Cellulomonas composti TaxID=266130 RepID=UPI0016498B62|nr:PQQ-binding-like beta-propeller repeat protein [Cellulomonas composti]